MPGSKLDRGRPGLQLREAECVREAFRQFLGGKHSYQQLAKLLGVTPRGMHLIMRNPIWMGWRILDKKRDTSAAGKYRTEGGRQGDRRKIARAEEDIIRVKVIDTPLLSEAEFQSVQQLMDQKQKRHWRSRPNYAHRFTYSGFLSCSACGRVIHTALARKDYYACKGRRALGECTTKYMGRERLETKLDTLFAEQLTSRAFLERCLETMEDSTHASESTATMQRLTSQVAKLKQKRAKVIELYLEGVIGRHDRDERLLKLDREITVVQDSLIRVSPPVSPEISSLVEAFAPLEEWIYWSREQKRSILRSLMPDIRVENYQVKALGISPAVFSNENTRTDMDSSPQPA